MMTGFALRTACQAHVLTDGLAAAEECQMPLLGFFAKAVREVAFPTPLVQKAAWLGVGIGLQKYINYEHVN